MSPRPSARVLKQVKITSGPPWCVRKVGYLDEVTQHVYFGPIVDRPTDPVTATTSFESAILAVLVEFVTVTRKDNLNGKATPSARKGAATGAFRT